MDTTATADTVPQPAAPVITVTGPNDWLAAAAVHRVRFPRSAFGQHERRQLGRCCAYLAERAEGGSAGTGAVIRRAAVILAAPPGAPELERMLGMRAALHLEGGDVRCRDCRKTWKCLPAEPYYEAASADDGLCLACMLAETRRDVAVPAIEPAGVIRPRKRKPAAPRRKAQPDEPAETAADDAEAEAGHE